MNVESIMTVNPKTCRESDHLADAAQLMWEHDLGAIPVTKGDGSGRLVGMLTDRDACMSAFFTGSALHQVSVAEAMSRNLMTCKPSDSVAHAAALLREARVRRLPVVDPQGLVVGLVALADLARVAMTSGGKNEIAPPTIVETLAAISTRPKPTKVEPEVRTPRALLPK